jgi:hypothetical protein
MLRSAIVLLVAGVVAAPALANDTSAELATGGLIFVRNDNIEMRSEDLTISAKEVSVRYRFFNTSDKDVTVLVAFPLPEIRIEEPDQIIAVPTEESPRPASTARNCCARWASRWHHICNRPMRRSTACRRTNGTS